MFCSLVACALNRSNDGFLMLLRIKRWWLWWWYWTSLKDPGATGLIYVFFVSLLFSSLFVWCPWASTPRLSQAASSSLPDQRPPVSKDITLQYPALIFRRVCSLAPLQKSDGAHLAHFAKLMIEVNESSAYPQTSRVWHCGTVCFYITFARTSLLFESKFFKL